MKYYEVLKIIVESAEDNILNVEKLFMNLGFTDDEMKRILEVIEGVREFDTVFESWIRRKIREKDLSSRFPNQN
jgi:hypothetical protein